jgi:hypothetical protein
MHEHREIDLHALAVGAAIVAGGVVFSLGTAWTMVHTLRASPSGPNGVSVPSIAGPAQTSDPHSALREFQREKQDLLEGQRSSAAGANGADASRVPIEEAMRRFSQRSSR